MSRHQRRYSRHCKNEETDRNTAMPPEAVGYMSAWEDYTDDDAHDTMSSEEEQIPYGFGPLNRKGME